MNRWLPIMMIALGCGHYESAPIAGDSRPSPQADAPQALPAASGPAAPPSTAGSETAKTENAIHRDAPSAGKAEKAAVGMGKRGRDYGGGMVTEPVRARFRAEERMALNSVEHAMNLFKAANDRLPKSHEEFMEKIIQFNNITLPPLPPGDEYWFDAEKGELMVRRPQ